MQEHKGFLVAEPFDGFLFKGEFAVPLSDLLLELKIVPSKRELKRMNGVVFKLTWEEQGKIQTRVLKDLDKTFVFTEGDVLGSNDGFIMKNLNKTTLDKLCTHKIIGNHIIEVNRSANMIFHKGKRL